MNGQRSSLIRGALALLLCAILLSSVLSTMAFAGKGNSPVPQEPAAGPVLGPAGGTPGDGGGPGGAGDPPTEGDPDDYDFVLVQIWVSLVESMLILIY